MCSNFSKIMENYQIQGDLSDVVRATATATAADGGATPSWQFPRNTLNYSSPQSDHQDFGDPFSHIRDPLMQNSNTTPLSEFFFAGDGAAAVSNSGINGGGVSQSHGGLDDEMKRPPNLFSKMLQISPCDSPAEVAAAPPQRGLKGPPYNLQISSPRNTGIKRRKSQAKKVVCIPAPTPANSRATGEIVPSDLWAWRKYGQKPIKGSPYPRGYYRCSSSKGCLARKQVERSRTDPNMLVITYTSDHNHPWPTQRNALAGSTRSQPSKKPMTTKQQQKENSSTMEDNCPDVKEELNQELDTEFDEVFPNTYKPTFTDSSSNHHQDTFFADLGEIGDDALDNLDLFQQGFSGDDKSDLDPFSFYDWGTDADNIAAASSGEESNRRS